MEVYICVKKGNGESRGLDWEGESGFTLIRALTDGKEAADHAITIFVCTKIDASNTVTLVTGRDKGYEESFAYLQSKSKFCNDPEQTFIRYC